MKESKDQNIMGDENTRSIKRAITQDTFVSVGIVLSLLAGVWWLSESLHRIDSRLMSIELRIENRWTYSDMKIWSQGLQIKNPSLFVPEVNGNDKKP